MRSSVDGLPASEGTNQSNNNNINVNNNRNRTNSENNGNSGSQYALCALGVGLIALGVVMIVWSIVPADPFVTNSSTSSGGSSVIDTRKNKASSVAFVLAGSGVAMLLLSLCLGMRNKQREQLRNQEIQNQREAATRAQEERETWVWSWLHLKRILKIYLFFFLRYHVWRILCWSYCLLRKFSMKMAKPFLLFLAQSDLSQDMKPKTRFMTWKNPGFHTVCWQSQVHVKVLYFFSGLLPVWRR